MHDDTSVAHRVAGSTAAACKRLTRLFAFVVCLVLSSFAVAACGGVDEPAGSDGATAPSGAPPKTPQGKLVIGDVQAGRVATWQPGFSLGGRDIKLSSLLYDSLISRDASKKLVPALATKWEQKDPRTLHVWLRRGVTFQDGQALTAADVKATLDQIGQPKSPVALAVVFTPMHVVVKNPYELDIVTDKPVAHLPDALTSAYIVSAKDIASDALKKRPNGTGPYWYVSSTNTRVMLKANPRYWEKGVPRIQTVQYESIQDNNALVNALRTGSVDVMEQSAPSHVAQFRGNSHFYIPPSTSYVPGYYNYLYRQKGPLANTLVRQAMAYAVNRSAIVKGPMQGLGKVSYSILPTTDASYQPCESRFDYDPAKAKALLKQAGYPNGFTLTMATSSAFPVATSADPAVAADLEKVGIKVKMTQVDTATYSSGVYTKYDMSLNAFVMLTGYTDSAFVIYRQPLLKAILNSTDAKMDALANQEAEFSGAKGEAMVQEAACYIWEQQPLMVLSDFYAPEIVSKKVQNYAPNGTFSISALKYAWIGSGAN